MWLLMRVISSRGVQAGGEGSGARLPLPLGWNVRFLKFPPTLSHSYSNYSSARLSKIPFLPPPTPPPRRFLFLQQQKGTKSSRKRTVCVEKIF